MGVAFGLGLGFDLPLVLLSREGAGRIHEHAADLGWGRGREQCQ